MKRIAVLICCLLLVASGATAWIGYGNPFREVYFYRPTNLNPALPPFFTGPCDENGMCQIHQDYQTVIHFSSGGRFGSGWERTVVGMGGNPVEVLREAGLKILPRPRYFEAALKWCTDGPIVQEFRHHSTHLIIPKTDDPVRTVRCVQRQTPGSFVASIGDPLGRETTVEPFVPLIKPWLERDKMLRESAASEQK